MRKLLSALLGGVTLGFALWMAMAPISKADPAAKCIVCHYDQGDKNRNAGPHDVAVACDKVDKYLADHPDDRAGSCTVTQTTNP